MRYRRCFRKRGATGFKIISFVLILLIVILLADAKLRPSIYDLAALEAESLSSEIVNNAVEKLLTDNALSYSEIVKINCSDNNLITGITTDIVKMNLLKSQISKAIDGEFDKANKTSVAVSLGTASGIALLSGVGPYIDVDIGFASSTHTDFENVFSSAGINQTQHNVMLNVKTTVILTLPGKRVTKTVATSFCVAQTVVVGTVPDILVSS